MLINPKEHILPTGEKVLIRTSTANDVLSICNHRKLTSGETYFMARYPEECSYNAEEMRSKLKALEGSPQDFSVTVFLDGEVIADLSITQLRSLLKFRHRAYMGMCVQEKYSSLGLGSTMLAIAIEQARMNGFEQIELGVFEDNARAIHLYEKFGFQKYGVQPKAFKLKDGTYRDELIMVLFL